MEMNTSQKLCLIATSQNDNTPGHPIKLVPVTALQSSMPTSAGDPTRFGPKKCIDGIIETPANFWDPNYSLCHTDVERAPWLAIDYGEKAAVSVEKVVLYNRKDCCYARTRNVEIWLANQIPTTGDEKFSGGQLLGTFHGSATRGQRIVIHSRQGWENKSGRYLILQIHHERNKDLILNLREVFAIGFSHKVPSKGSFTTCRSELARLIQS